MRGSSAWLALALLLACRSGGSSSIPSSDGPSVDTLRRGESLYTALRKKGVEPKYILELSRSLKRLVNLRRVMPGGKYAFSCDSTGAIVWFRYMPDLETEIVAERRGGKLEVTRRKLPLERVERSLAGAIGSSLYDAVLEAGGTPRLVWKFADIFQWEIDFHTEPRSGDRFAVVWEEYRRDGRTVREGRILAAAYIGKVGEFWAVYYRDPRGHEDYYDLKGRSLRKAFLRSPLRYRRISSRFSRRRLHPILRRYMPHWGVDYAAPPGTPVHATADGVVLFRGHKGPNGNMVILGHRNGYRTYYLHLSRFARGIRRGRRVEQGQVIGYVGATGLATGPHLDYRVRRGRKFLNPLKLEASRAPSVPKRYLREFQAVRDRYKTKLEEALNEEMVVYEDLDRNGLSGSSGPFLR